MLRKNIVAISIERFRASASIQRSLGLKVGGTGTKWLVRDTQTKAEGYVTTYGATPGERKTAAINQFMAGVCDNGTKPTVPKPYDYKPYVTPVCDQCGKPTVASCYCETNGCPNDINRDR